MIWQPFWTGLVVAIVGFFSSFPIFLAGVSAMGAEGDMAASALMSGAVSMGLAGLGLSLWFKIPASVAWSTPGVALLAISSPDPAGFPAAVGAFMFAGALTVVAGLWPPLGRLAHAIPTALTQAMLAGVLFSICIGPFRALQDAPQIALPLLLTWFLVGRFTRLMAVPATVVVAVALILIVNGGALSAPEHIVTRPVLVWPVLSWPALIGLGLPLFIVTMATQNIPGLSVLKANGYRPNTKSMFGTVGVFSILSAPFGAAATCVAAITAAMCTSDDAHPDPAQRYLAAVWAGVFYCLLGLFAGVMTHVASVAPDAVLPVLAGLALLPVFMASASEAWQDGTTREAAVITFLMTASGVTFLGLGAAVWGLIAGGGVHVVQRWRRA
ncbi:MAG: benzoate/H(+) symporter BenE family transporter [Rhodobacteraceae bacterium]|nr:benzoate/H(+) symporter BenE family transporter [Paracoccaceae bacterium]